MAAESEDLKKEQNVIEKDTVKRETKTITATSSSQKAVKKTRQKAQVKKSQKDTRYQKMNIDQELPTYLL